MGAEHRESDDRHRVESLGAADDSEDELVDSTALVGSQQVAALDHVDGDLDQGAAFGHVSQRPPHHDPLEQFG